jgi:hypothetical protein
MSLLDTASLIVTPNGYKEGKLYSVIPSDGSGDMSVVRATTATRVNSAGLVELVPYNLLSWSEDFSTTRGFFANVAGGSTAVFTANYAAAPNGTTTADRIQLALNGQPYADWVQPLSLPLVTGSTYTYSIYLKSLSGSASLIIFNDGVSNISKTITTDWQRYDYTWTATTGGVFPRFLLQAGTSTSADLVAWGYQLVEGSTAKDYQKTETRLNIPRLDYSNGTCPSLLVEPQRTNLLLNSSSFNNAFWNKFNGLTVTANNAVSPDGTQNADTLNVSNNSNILYGVLTGTFIGNTYTFSLYAKGSGNFTMNIRLNSSTTTSETKTLTSQWQRFNVTVTNAAPVIAIEFFLDLNTSSTYNIWGAQLELGSYSTSYIPTTSASVTRNADVISKTGISSLIGQTEGTLFVDFDFDGSGYGTTNDFFLYVGDGANTDAIYIDYYNNIFRWVVFNGSTLVFYTDIATTNGRHKLALGYKAGQYVAYADGNLILADTNATAPPTCAMLSLAQNVTGFGSIAKEINAAALWQTRLTNTQLAQLTSI